MKKNHKQACGGFLVPEYVVEDNTLENIEWCLLRCEKCDGYFWVIAQKINMLDK